VFLIECRQTFQRYVLPPSSGRWPLIALMMEAARISETSVDIQLRTRQCIPEDSELRTRRRENLKSHTILRILKDHTSESDYIFTFSLSVISYLCTLHNQLIKLCNAVSIATDSWLTLKIRALREGGSIFLETRHYTRNVLLLMRLFPFIAYYISLLFAYNNALCNFPRVVKFILPLFLSGVSSIEIPAARYVYIQAPFKCFIHHTLSLLRRVVNMYTIRFKNK
jgi:hypothetical protein